MQHGPNKQGYNNYVNQYPPMNQPQYGGGNVYPPNNAPPGYAQYPQQPVGYATPVYQQQPIVVAPVYSIWHYNPILTTITPGLRIFCILSGILYLVWGILAMGLEIGILANSYRTYYRGFWAGFFLIAGGISLLVTACKESYPMIHLIRMFSTALVFVILGLILSIVDVAISSRCGYYYSYSCDYALASNLKIVILVAFIISTIHTIVNMVVVSNAQKATNSKTSNPA